MPRKTASKRKTKKTYKQFSGLKSTGKSIVKNTGNALINQLKASAKVVGSAAQKELGDKLIELGKQIHKGNLPNSYKQECISCTSKNKR